MIFFDAGSRVLTSVMPAFFQASDILEPLALPAEGYETSLQLTDVWDTQAAANTGLQGDDLLRPDLVTETVPQSATTKTSLLPSTSSAVAVADLRRPSRSGS